MPPDSDLQAEKLQPAVDADHADEVSATEEKSDEDDDQQRGEAEQGLIDGDQGHIIDDDAAYELSTEVSDPSLTSPVTSSDEPSAPTDPSTTPAMEIDQVSSEGSEDNKPTSTAADAANVSESGNDAASASVDSNNEVTTDAATGDEMESTVEDATPLSAEDASDPSTATFDAVEGGDHSEPPPHPTDS